MWTYDDDVAVRKSLSESSELREIIAGNVFVPGDVMVIDAVDQEVVVLDLDVGCEARVESCHDFIEALGQQLSICWRNLYFVSF